MEYEKSINAEIIQPFQSPYETMIFLTRVHVWVLHLSLNNLVYFKINSVVVKKRIPLSFHVLRETWSPLCVYISVWMSVRVKSFPWLHKEPKNIYFDVRLCWSKAFKWKLPLLKLIIRDIKTFLPFEEKEMILGSCCELTDNS